MHLCVSPPQHKSRTGICSITCNALALFFVFLLIHSLRLINPFFQYSLVCGFDIFHGSDIRRCFAQKITRIVTAAVIGDLYACVNGRGAFLQRTYLSERIVRGQ